MTHRKEVRRNSQSRSPRAQYMVLVRRFDTDPDVYVMAGWKPLYLDEVGVTFFSLSAAKRAALTPPRSAGLHVGDLVAVVPADGVSDVSNNVRHLYVVAPKGVVAAPEPPNALGGPWVPEYGTNAGAMLLSAAQVDRRRVVMAACACAETVLHLVPVGEERPRRALEAAMAWCRTRGSESAKRDALNASQAAYSATDTLAGAAAAAAMACRSASASVASSLQLAANAAGSVCAAMHPIYTREAQAAAMLALAPLVERWIPLPVAILSALGNPNAIPFDPSTVPTSSTGPRENPRRRRRVQ